MADQLADLLAYCRADGRVCPVPSVWHRFWRRLDRYSSATDHPPAPLILAAWHQAAPEAKGHALEQQMRWAAEHGALAVAERFLRALPLDEWHREPASV